MRIKCTYHLSDFMVDKLEKEIGENSSSTRPVGLAGLVIPSDDPMVLERSCLHCLFSYFRDAHTNGLTIVPSA